MPTYDYRCPECGHEQEEFHWMNVSPKIRCPDCGTRMEKLIGAGGRPIFKGTGFYETDYRKGEQANKRIVEKVLKEAPREQLEEGGL